MSATQVHETVAGGVDPAPPRFRPLGLRRDDGTAIGPNAVAWAIVAMLVAGSIGVGYGLGVLVVGSAAILIQIAASRRAEARRWVEPLRAILKAHIDGEVDHPSDRWAAEIRRLVDRPTVRGGEAGPGVAAEEVAAEEEAESPFVRSGEIEIPPQILAPPLLSRSMLLDGPHGDGVEVEADNVEPGEMINRLDPDSLRWIESSPAEQEFLGWPIEGLREKSFLEIVDLEDRELARSQLASAIAKGEGHNLLYRVRTARDEVKAVEIHVSMRYSVDGRPNHVRMHLADMTKKVRAERELRRRTKELIDANHLLRRINRELEEVKDRYRDLYHNAPAMYFSLDLQGTVVECNNTLLQTLGRDRASVVGHSYAVFLSPRRRANHSAWLSELRRSGRVEFESRWVKSDGREIDVWLTSAAVLGPDGQVAYSRSVARDVSQRRALEAELRDKNERLARTNDELSRKNRELDEFTYIIAHDLKEPLRTLIAFSDFLEKDCGDRLDDTGKDHLHQIVDAARRMRSLIQDLQTLSQAGRVIGEFAPVRLERVVERIRKDLAELIRERAAEIRVVGDLPRIWGDGVRIAQLLANLIVNGLKYNLNEHPRIEVAIVPPPDEKRQAGFATLAVRDNGIGIDPKFHAKVFQLFRRLHTREEFEGTGAGLAICKKIAHAHGGWIWVESEAGRGSTFFVNLPIAEDQTPTPEIAPHAV